MKNCIDTILKMINSSSVCVKQDDKPDTNNDKQDTKKKIIKINLILKRKINQILRKNILKRKINQILKRKINQILKRKINQILRKNILKRRINQILKRKINQIL